MTLFTGRGARALVKIYNDSTKSTDLERDVYFLLFYDDDDDGGGGMCSRYEYNSRQLSFYPSRYCSTDGPRGNR